MQPLVVVAATRAIAVGSAPVCVQVLRLTTGEQLHACTGQCDAIAGEGYTLPLQLIARNHMTCVVDAVRVLRQSGVGVSHEVGGLVHRVTEPASTSAFAKGVHGLAHEGMHARTIEFGRTDGIQHGAQGIVSVAQQHRW